MKAKGMPPQGLGPHNPYKGVSLGREKRGDADTHPDVDRP